MFTNFNVLTEFSVSSGETLCGFFDFLKPIEERLQALILSMFAAILRKSTYNLEQCSKNEFIMKIIALLPHTRDVVAELLGDILSVLAQYNLSVDELKALMKQLRSIDNGEGRHTWNHNSLKLIEVLTSHRFIICIFGHFCKFCMHLF